MDYIIPAKFFNGTYGRMRKINLQQWKRAVEEDKKSRHVYPLADTE